MQPYQTQLAQVQAFLMALQDQICQQLQQADGGAVFVEDAWQIGRAHV